MFKKAYLSQNILLLSETDTVFTRLNGGTIETVSNRPAILVSSSSWTEDEDFHLLIDAFESEKK